MALKGRVVGGDAGGEPANEPAIEWAGPLCEIVQKRCNVAVVLCLKHGMSDSQWVGGEISRMAESLFVAIMYVRNRDRVLTIDIGCDSRRASPYMDTRTGSWTRRQDSSDPLEIRSGMRM